MNELFLYDRDKGLFKEILKLSTVIEGRYAVLKSGYELNTDNFDALIKDPATGISSVDQKYPVVVCMPPISEMVLLNDQNYERFRFSMFFLTRTGVTGQNKIKSPDSATGLSTHHVWYDWKDMNECASGFHSALNQVTRNSIINIDDRSQPLSVYCILDAQPVIVRRVSNLGTDKVSGVNIQFVIYLFTDICTAIPDYPSDLLSQLTIPDTDIHPLHKH